MDLPSGLDWLRGSEQGRAWLDALPDVVDACAARWGLSVGRPFPYAYTSLALPAVRAGGASAVVKVMFPGRENEHEALALRAWDGDGAVRLLDEIPELHALLLERCVPGTPLSDAAPKTALAVLAGMLPRLWKPASSPPFRALADEAAWWASHLRQHWMEAGRPFESRLVDAALDALAALSPTQGEAVLLHQDLHGANVLAAEREPWLAIDPKPLAGEREFGLAPIVRSTELGHSRREVLGRLDRLASELGLDRERARLWCLGQTVAWSIDGGAVLDEHVDVARWLLDG